MYLPLIDFEGLCERVSSAQHLYDQDSPYNWFETHPVEQTRILQMNQS